MGRRMERNTEGIDPRLLALKGRLRTWKEVARALDVTERTLTNWVSRGIPEKMDERVGDVMAGRKVQGKKVRKK